MALINRDDLTAVGTNGPPQPEHVLIHTATMGRMLLKSIGSSTMSALPELA